MMWLSDLFYLLGLPQFTEAPIYFDVGMLVMALVVLWLIVDIVAEEMRQRRAARTEQWLTMLIHMQDREPK